jgi:hypothetical protein
MGVLSLEGGHTAAADHAAVFIVGFGKQQDVLGSAAPGDHIAPAQIGPQAFPQLVHDPVSAPFA